LAAALKLPDSTTVKNTFSWPTLGTPGSDISNILNKTSGTLRVSCWMGMSIFDPEVERRRRSLECNPVAVSQRSDGQARD
jgi:hypothetical protein